MTVRGCVNSPRLDLCVCVFCKCGSLPINLHSIYLLVICKQRFRVFIPSSFCKQICLAFFPLYETLTVISPDRRFGVSLWCGFPSVCCEKCELVIWVIIYLKNFPVTRSRSVCRRWCARSDPVSASKSLCVGVWIAHNLCFWFRLVFCFGVDISLISIVIIPDFVHNLLPKCTRIN